MPLQDLPDTGTELLFPRLTHWQMGSLPPLCQMGSQKIKSVLREKKERSWQVSRCFSLSRAVYIDATAVQLLKIHSASQPVLFSI